VCITLFFCASITLRGVTVVNIDPFSLDFVALWLTNVVVCSSLILVVSVVLVWVPVYDGRHASRTLADMHMVSVCVGGGGVSCLGNVCGVGGLGRVGQQQPDSCGVGVGAGV
jgi:heme/copper-type cytochrome/quinol oxidase subunit 1